MSSRGPAADLLRAIQINDDAYPTLLRFLAWTRAGKAAGPELEANAARLTTARCLLVALLGHSANADLNPQSAPKRTLTNRCSPFSIYEYAA
jgi:hypothetical protein